MAALVMVALTLSSVSAAASDSARSILNSTDEITLGLSIVAVLAIAAGAVVCAFGYRLFRVAIFMCGFIVGGIAVASAIEFLFKSEDWMETASWIGFFVGGLIVAIIAVLLYTFSIFVIGAAAGVLLAFTVHTTVAYKVYPSEPNVVLVILCVLLAIIGGVLALTIEKPVLVVATSFVGAVALVWGVGYFAGEYPNGADLKHYSSVDINGDTIVSIPSAWWGYLAGTLVLFVLGMMIQFGKTGRGDYHTLALGRKQLHNPHAVPAYDDLQTPPANGQGGNPRYGNPVSHV